MVSQKKFLLGLGCQKCGTTWLSEYLRQHKNYDGGFAKEYHIGDGLDLPPLRRNLIGKVPLKEKLFANKAILLRHRMQTEENFYFDYFDSLFVDGVSVSADITPSYSGLSEKRLKFIHSQFQNREVDCKAVILIRNPLNRVKSAVRFNLDRGNYNEGIESGEKNFFNALRQYYASEHCKFRTNYHITIERALSVFGESGVYVGIYENLFNAEEIERLPDFCQVQVKAEYGAVRVNKTRNKTEQDDELESEVKSFYKDVYEYCYEKFPITKQLWC